jgi:hypothetical protein
MAKKGKSLSASDSARRSTGSWFSVVTVILVAVAAALTYQYINANNKKAEDAKAAEASGWRADEDMEIRSKGVQCDLHIFESVGELSSRKDLLDRMNGKPFIVRNVVSKWPAKYKWKFANFSSIYGDKMVKTGSESSIVYGGGAAGITKNVTRILADMRSQNYSDYFTFDVSILQSIPALRQDYRVPPALFDWDTPVNEKQGLMWHMLSMGASRSGLPFHVHGATWLGLVFGKKRWFLYPPGYGQPESTHTAFSTVRPVYDWFVEVYPTLLNLPKPSLFWVDITGSKTLDDTDHVGAVAGYRPFECIQNENDLMFLPNGWSHQTLNVGEAVALGGQAALTATDRLKLANDVLLKFPRNVDALKASGLSLAHHAIEIEELSKSELQVTSSGLVRLTKENFVRLVYDSEDTWLIHVFDRNMNTTGVPGEAFSRTWHSVASRLRGLVSVGAVELESGIAGGTDILDVERICKCRIAEKRYLLSATVQEGEETAAEPRPLILLVLGGNITDQVFYPADRNLSSADISDFALDYFFDTTRKLEHGSAATLGAKARRLLKQAVQHLRSLFMPLLFELSSNTLIL